jgi:hypothetical protein
MWNCLPAGSGPTASTPRGHAGGGREYGLPRVSMSSWFWAVYRMRQGKNGVSALPLSKETGVSYPAIWLLVHRLRKAMANQEEKRKLHGLIEVDESYVGGNERRTERIGRFTQNKSIVAAVATLERGGEAGR